METGRMIIAQCTQLGSSFISACAVLAEKYCSFRRKGCAWRVPLARSSGCLAEQNLLDLLLFAVGKNIPIAGRFQAAFLTKKMAKMMVGNTALSEHYGQQILLLHYINEPG